MAARRTLSETACRALLEKHKGDVVAAIREAYRLGLNAEVMQVVHKEEKK